MGLAGPRGQHGLVGYTVALPGYDRAFNTLTGSLYGVGRVHLVYQLLPEPFQPFPTLAEPAGTAGTRIHQPGPAFHQWPGSWSMLTAGPVNGDRPLTSASHRRCAQVTQMIWASAIQLTLASEGLPRMADSWSRGA